MAPANHLPLKLFSPIAAMEEQEIEYELRKSLAAFFKAQSSQMHNFETVSKLHSKRKYPLRYDFSEGKQTADIVAFSHMDGPGYASLC